MTHSPDGRDESIARFVKVVTSFSGMEQKFREKLFRVMHRFQGPADASGSLGSNRLTSGIPSPLPAPDGRIGDSSRTLRPKSK